MIRIGSTTAGAIVAVAEHMLLDARRIDDVAVEIEQRFAIRKIERRVRMHLAPDEHVLGRER